MISIANQPHVALHVGHGREACGRILRILDELVDYTVKHFAFEEKLMREHGYPQTEAHPGEHKKLIADVTRFKKRWDAGETAAGAELMAFVAEWLIKHIMKVDKALAESLDGRVQAA